MTDPIEAAYLAWVKDPDAPVTSQSIFRAGYLAGCKEAAELKSRIRILEQENADLKSRIKTLKQENAWLESHGKDWGCQVIK